MAVIGGINLAAIYVANMMGLTICGMTMFDTGWQALGSKRESKLLKTMLICGIISCIMDPLVFACDGKPGIFSYIVVYFGNLWLFLANIILGPAWADMVSYHITGTVHKARRWLHRALCSLGVIVLALNFVVPIVFSVSDANVYTRGPAYWLFLALEVLFILDGILVYLTARIRGGLLKFFPVGQFIIPAIIGIAIQSAVYGLSTIWPFMAISISSVVHSLKSEAIYRDQLTGTYNRHYLDYIKNGFVDAKHSGITAMMLDLNGFKSINDRFGHNEGDEALIQAASLMAEAVGSLGTVIRYAGDEFVLLLNTQDEDTVAQCVSGIYHLFDWHNKKSGKPYQLSASIGYCSFDLKTQSVEEVMNAIDKKMYEDKKRYYSTYPQMDRRQGNRE